MKMSSAHNEFACLLARLPCDILPLPTRMGDACRYIAYGVTDLAGPKLINSPADGAWCSKIAPAVSQGFNPFPRRNNCAEHFKRYNNERPVMQSLSNTV